jgi:hypothetical protein
MDTAWLGPSIAMLVVHCWSPTSQVSPLAVRMATVRQASV